MKEDVITFAVKEKLIDLGWNVLVYKSPGGHGGFYIPHPEYTNRKGIRLAMIPDIIAIKDKNVLLIESKSRFNRKDKEKLDKLLANPKRRGILKSLLDNLCKHRGIEIDDTNQLVFTKSLAYHTGNIVPEDFIVFKVIEEKHIDIVTGENIPYNLIDLSSQ